MKLVYRRLVYLTFVIIFLVTAPSVILYTQGYRFNLKRGKIQKTGILIVSSLPKKADVYLNNDLVENDPTPTRVEQLLPADYEIKVIKDGYHTWQKKLSVYDNTTTFAEDILLWKENYPTLLINQEASDWLISPDNQKLVTLDENKQVILIQFNFDQISAISDLSKYDNLDILTWSNTSKKILIKAAKDKTTSYFILNIEQQPRPKLIKITDKDYLKVKWDATNDNIIYGLNQQGIWKMDLFTQQEELIGPLVENNFLIKDNNLYTCKGNELIQENMSNLNESKVIEQINCQDYEFIDQNTNKVLLHNTNKQELLIIDPENKVKPVTTYAKAISWLNNNTLLFYTDWELWIFDLNKNEPELITRLGSTIQKAIWHPEGRHIIFVSDNKIKIIELDNRELRNIIQLAEINNIQDLEINDKGTDLYFSGQITDKPEILKLNIR